MIRTLKATSALALLLTTSGYAQDNSNTVAPATNNQAAPAQQEIRQPAEEVSFLGSQLMGEQVYNGTADNAENIGDVKDVVIGQNGEVQFIVVGVGGFLGIGEKDIAVAFKDVQWSERNGDRWLVVPFTKDQLTAQAEFDRTPYETAANTTTARHHGDHGQHGRRSGRHRHDGQHGRRPAPATNAPADTTATAPAANGTTDNMAQAPATATDPAAPGRDHGSGRHRDDRRDRSLDAEGDCRWTTCAPKIWWARPSTAPMTPMSARSATWC